MRIRPEVPADVPAIRSVNEAAFGSPEEANIIEALRKKPAGLISLVAESEGRVLGHILFSPVLLEGHSGLSLMGLGPVAVQPDHQRRGIGSALIREGLDRCREYGSGAVVVLGHPEYYPRFGFVRASRRGISCEYDVPDEAFMLIELQPRYLQNRRGKVIYDEAFGGS